MDSPVGGAQTSSNDVNTREINDWSVHDIFPVSGTCNTICDLINSGKTLIKRYIK